MTLINATVTSDSTRTWTEKVYTTIADGLYPEDYPNEYLRGKQRYKSVWTGQMQNKRAGHGGRDVPSGKSVVFVNVKDETLFENFAARTTRPYAAWKPFVEEALRAHGFEFSKLTWSNKAGCSCPCSPGFIVTTGTRGHNIWVTIEADELQTTDEDEAAHRASQLAAQL